MKFPNNPKDYREFFEALAENHPAIMATESNKRFSIINQSAVPFSSWDKSEFDNLLKTTSTHEPDGNACIMAVIMMDEDHEGASLQNSTINGSFLIAKRTKQNDFAERLDAQTAAYKTGKEIMAWIEQFFSINRKYGGLDFGSCNNEGIGPLGRNNMYGWIFNFAFSNKIKVCVSPDTWNDFLPQNIDDDND